MTIILTDHTKKRMAQRAISFDMIRNTIEMPDYTVQKGKKTDAYKRFEGKRLKIVYAGKDKYIKVISVMWR